MIYLLEDDSGIRSFVTYALNSSGFEAAGFETPSAFYEAMSSTLPDLLLLDIMLPEEDGLSVLRKLRADPATAQLPVIMLTAKSSEFDKVTGLDSGADDYIAKPFGTMELISRIRALLRRSSGSRDSTSISVGGLTLFPEKHTVSADGSPVALTLKEFELLLFLMRNAGTVFSRDVLLQKIWGYDFSGESRTVDVHIRTLRSKLGSCGELIRTVRGVGYKIGETADD
ncbi:MAG: response regulator transcription factor [Ruminococcus sp.]|nr:response regulator transcription factor [Ruminococcus sp.]